MEICKKENCTGCFACVSKCPKGCISMCEDEIGHIYPIINNETCINCGACVKVCPANSPVILKTPLNTYAAYSLDEEEHKSSSSGGVAAEFSKHVVKNGGIVYGCSSLVNVEICHIAVEKEEELFHLKGSKYVHSYINDVYRKAQDDLLKGKTVLFTGTPCQIAGLKNFLGKDYSNLITVDIICHGVPSQRLLKEHLNTHVDNPFMLSFRNNYGYTLRVSDPKDSRELYSKPHTKDLYFVGFYKNIFFRDSCYNCYYAKIDRCSDITIGDFWGLGKKEPFNGNSKNGVSVVLVNTEKGKAFFETVAQKLYTEKRSLHEAVSGNAQLNHPSVAHPKRERFIELYKSYGFKRAVKKSLALEIFKYRLLYHINNSKLLAKMLNKLRG